MFSAGFKGSTPPDRDVCSCDACSTGRSAGLENPVHRTHQGFARRAPRVPRVHLSAIWRRPVPNLRADEIADLGRFVVGACRASLRSSPIAHWMIFSVTECEIAHIRMSYFDLLGCKALLRFGHSLPRPR